MPDKKPKSPLRRWRDFTWRGPSLGWLAAFALVFVLGLVALFAAGLLGARQGLAERHRQATVQAGQFYEQGLAFAQAGQLEQAAQAFEQALRLNPDNQDARQQLQALQTPVAVEVTPPTSVQPILVAPSSADGQPTVSAVEFLFLQAEQAVQNGQWTLATGLIEQLASIDPQYRKADLDGLRFQLALQQGLKLAAEGRMEEAVRAFDQALTYRPDDAEAQTQRQLAALYANALGAWRVDWPTAVKNLEAVIDLDPNYLDVANRLVEAYERWGDRLLQQGDWCQAARRFASAVQAATSPELEAKRKEAAELCANPPTPTPTPPVDTTGTATLDSSGVGLIEGAGHLAFASYSPEFNRWTIYRLTVRGGQQPLSLVEHASQPALSPSGSQLLVRSERGDQTGLGVMPVGAASWLRLTTFAEDGHPRWSPDGQQIVFDSNREADRRWRIYRMWAGPGNETSLGFGRWPAWSPQGNLLAYQGCDESGNRCGLWLMNFDGANPRPVTDVPGDAMPAWSPNGGRLAFASADRTGNWDVFVINLSSGDVAPLAASPGIDAHPVWSPDGSQVALLSNRDGGWAIYIVQAATGQVSRIVPVPGSVPDWFEAQISWGP